MLTDTKLLELIYGAAISYVPHKQLTEEQSERLGHIKYQWCDCQMCKTSFWMDGKPTEGHASIPSSELYLSKQFFKRSLSMQFPALLLNLIKTALHETVHILFPEFDEKQTEAKTFEWLKNNEWVN